MKRNYIFINTKRKKLYLDTFKRNVLMPIGFLLGIAAFFVTMWFMFLLAYAFQGEGGINGNSDISNGSLCSYNVYFRNIQLSNTRSKTKKGRKKINKVRE